MDDPNITMEEYIRLEEEKAHRNGKVYNWETDTDQRYQCLRFEGLQYTNADIVDFETRLGKIYMREVHSVQVFAFEGLTDLMAEGDLMLRRCHRLIACSIAGRSQGPEKVIVIDLFYLRGMDVGSINIPYLLASTEHMEIISRIEKQLTRSQQEWVENLPQVWQGPHMIREVHEGELYKIIDASDHSLIQTAKGTNLRFKKPAFVCIAVDTSRETVNKLLKIRQTINSFLSKTINELTNQSFDSETFCPRERIKELELRTKQRDDYEEEMFKDMFPIKEELAYHKELLGHAYIDLLSPINIMSRAYYNKIREKSFQARRNPGNIIDSTLSKVVLGKPFAQTSKLAYDEFLRLYLTRRSLEVLRKFHWTILRGRFNQLSHVSSPLLSKPGEY
nr:hypothetical protein [Tanacetum cinerariifolium]